MRNILIITKNNSFIDKTEEYLRNSEQTLLTTPDYEQAISTIESTQIDIIITCFSTAADNNFSLLSSLENNQISIPIIVCAPKITDTDANILDSFAAFNFISGTMEPATLQAHINKSLSKGAKGHIAGVSLASFLQLIELDRKTCTLRIKLSGKTGVLYFHEGEIIDAVSGQTQGETAALQIVGWAPVEIDIWESCRKTIPNITSPLGFLLIEGNRLRDEQEHEKQQLSEAGDEEKAPETNTPPAPQDTVPSPVERPAKKQKLLDRLIEAVGNYKVNSLFISKADGTALAQENCAPHLVKLIQNSAESALDLANAFNYQAPKQIILEHSSTARLLILIGPGVHVGVEIDNELPPTIIAGDLAPIIKRLHFS